MGSKLSKPHSISRPGELPTRSTPPNALTLNIGDLPGDLLQASQLAVTVTAARVLPDNTDGSIRLGPHEVSLLQMMTPYISVHRTPPEILYTSLDECAPERKLWQCQSLGTGNCVLQARVFNVMDLASMCMQII